MVEKTSMNNSTLRSMQLRPSFTSFFYNRHISWKAPCGTICNTIRNFMNEPTEKMQLGLICFLKIEHFSERRVSTSSKSVLMKNMISPLFLILPFMNSDTFPYWSIYVMIIRSIDTWNRFQFVFSFFIFSVLGIITATTLIKGVSFARISCARVLVRLYPYIYESVIVCNCMLQRWKISHWIRRWIMLLSQCMDPLNNAGGVAVRMHKAVFDRLPSFFSSTFSFSKNLE